MHAYLTSFGDESLARDAQDVAQVVIFKHGIGIHTNIIPADVHLDFAFLVLNMGEGRLAHHPAAHHTASDGHLLAVQLLYAILDVLAGMADGVAGHLVGAVILRDEFRQFGAADALLLGKGLDLLGML